MEKWKCSVCGYVHEGPLPEGFVCPKCKKPTRIGHKLYEDGKKDRICKKCGETI